MLKINDADLHSFFIIQSSQPVNRSSQSHNKEGLAQNFAL
jgi:hypothetical protein